LWIIFSTCVYLLNIFDIAIPAGLFGILVLFIWFVIFKCVALPIKRAAQPLLSHMSLFFLPAIVGIVNYTDLLATHALALILAIVVATLLSLLITAVISQWLINRMDNHENSLH
jgi:holin-like protein